jgi:tetratricopeptide (TPR) repeat protein
MAAKMGQAFAAKLVHVAGDDGLALLRFLVTSCSHASARATLLGLTGEDRATLESAPSAAAKSYQEYIKDSLALCKAGECQKSLEAAQGALALQPDPAVAYNNICAAYNQLKQWDKAIEACEKALAIRPNFELARNNLRAAQLGKR